MVGTLFEAILRRPPWERNGHVFHQADNPGIESALHRALGLWFGYQNSVRSWSTPMRPGYSWAPRPGVPEHLRVHPPQVSQPEGAPMNTLAGTSTAAAQPRRAGSSFRGRPRPSPPPAPACLSISRLSSAEGGRASRTRPILPAKLLKALFSHNDQDRLSPGATARGKRMGARRWP